MIQKGSIRKSIAFFFHPSDSFAIKYPKGYPIRQIIAVLVRAS